MTTASSFRRPTHSRCILVLLWSLVLSFASAQDEPPQTIPIPWGFPANSQTNATVGDTLQFVWTNGVHDVWMHPSNDCSETDGAIRIAGQSITGSVDYTLQPQDGSPEGTILFFVCQVGIGVHCLSGVNQRVLVFSRLNTEAPTVAPTVSPTGPTTSFPSASPSTSVPTPSPSTSIPSASPSTSPPTTSIPTTSIPTFMPTNATIMPTTSPSMGPTRMGSMAPSMATLTPTLSPSNATDTPTAAPSNATAAPSPMPSMAVLSDTPSLPPTLMPETSPSPTMTPITAPPITDVPSGLPSTLVPSATPSLRTPSPTTSIISATLPDLEMTLVGISDMSEEDLSTWQSVTALYQTAYFQGNPISTGVIELETELQVTGRRRRRRRHRKLQDGNDADADEVTIVYQQQLTYRLTDPDVTSATIVTDPFATTARRDQYVSIYLNSVASDSVLVDVTDSSIVTGPGIVAPTPAPASAGEGPGPNDDDDDDDGLSTGAVIGIVAASLLVALVGGLCLCGPLIERCYPGEENGGGEKESFNHNNVSLGDDDEDDNPYQPPPPNFLQANDNSIEQSA